MNEPAGAMTLVLCARGVTLRGGAAAFARGFDLAVAAGSIHALLGANGAGKSTFLAAALGAAPFAGSIERCDAVAFVPQRFVPDPTLALTVAEFLALTRQARPLLFGTAPAAARSARALELAGLAGFGDRPLHALSGGELRRLLLGHALELAASLLLLDEPTEGLDAAARARLADQLRAARQRGAGVLLVTHDRAFAAAVADHTTDLDADGLP
ncbi:MAG: ATP-binding cassette domain-containing protein [Planctomycetes bacterium]|nr:ATP-binding cassette domain-containing protein [Planctomycetota bacterium]